MLTLVAAMLERGRRVDLLLCRAKGPLLEVIPEGVNVIELPASGGLASRALLTAQVGLRALRPVVLAKKIAPEVTRVSALARYLDNHGPDALLSALTYANLTALWANQLAKHPVPVVVSERNALATACADPRRYRKWRFRYLPPLVRHTYPQSAAVVAVSEHVERELREDIGLQHPRLVTLHNPVVDENLRKQAAQPLDHPWFAPHQPPVVLAVGRLTQQKDLPTLLHAFALLRERRPARLMILGDGDLREELTALCERLHIAENVALPGFVMNPFPYMARAGVLALTSVYEGLPGVLIQAMACGCPVVSTDCRGGSREILVDGKYGPLVPVGDAPSLADALTAQLQQPTPSEQLRQRANDFGVTQATTRYLALLDEVAAAPSSFGSRG